MLDRLAVHAATIEANRRSLRALSLEVISAQEEERKRIAGELHDETSQSLASLLIALERIDSSIPDDLPHLKDRLRAARGLTRRALDDLRAVVADLRPLVLDDLGLAPAIRWYASDRLEPEGIDVTVEADANLPRLPRVGRDGRLPDRPGGDQQRPQPCRRRPGAHPTRVPARTWSSKWMTTASGSTPCCRPPPDGRQHMGLFGIRERAAALGGVASVESTPGEGTRVRVAIPLQALEGPRG